MMRVHIETAYAEDKDINDRIEVVYPWIYFPSSYKIWDGNRENQHD